MASGTERHSSNVLEKFKITVKKADNTLSSREIDGYRISIPGCPDAKLFVHKAHNGDDKWCVTEETSGFQLCSGASKPAAVGRARRQITEMYDKFPAAVASAVKTKDSGVAPAVSEDVIDRPVTPEK